MKEAENQLQTKIKDTETQLQIGLREIEAKIKDTESKLEIRIKEIEIRLAKLGNEIVETKKDIIELKKDIAKIHKEISELKTSIHTYIARWALGTAALQTTIVLTFMKLFSHY
ncbi:MAG: hypothetical protein REH83_02710 [Rickettsiella sp.]|nr:hypothetical protein [Rickettsiella sp.]